METSLRLLLTGAAAISALVGQRVFWGTIPQGATNPLVALYLISRIPGYTMQGGDGLDESRVQIDIRDTDLARAWQVRDAIKALVSGYRGTVSGTYLSGIFIQSERQRFDRTDAESFHTLSLDVQIWSKPAS